MSNGIIKVRWQSRNGAHMIPAHGFDFHVDSGKNTVIDNIPRAEGSIFDKHWLDYVVELAEECSCCLRVWVNNEIVWDYEHHWFYTKDELRQREWEH